MKITDLTAGAWQILPLLGGAVASAGVFVSLHAATVRQAQQTLMFAMVGLLSSR